MRSTGLRECFRQSLLLQSWGVQNMVWAFQVLPTSNYTPGVLNTALETDHGKAFCSRFGLSKYRSTSSLSTMLRITVRAMTSNSRSSVTRSDHSVPQFRMKEKAMLKNLQLYVIHGVQGFRVQCMPVHALSP